jgi:shikimate 5-dehydrogenase
MTMIRGTTELIAHIGFPTHSFKSPVIYNPYFEQTGVDAVVVPMGCRAEHFPSVLRAVFTLTNTRGALITMPHKVAAAAIVDEASPAVRIAGSCNAVRHLKDGRLHGDLFDGEGFVKALSRKGCQIAGARAFIVGAGGVVQPLQHHWPRRTYVRSHCGTSSPIAPWPWSTVSGRSIRTSS